MAMFLGGYSEKHIAHWCILVASCEAPKHATRWVLTIYRTSGCHGHRLGGRKKTQHMTTFSYKFLWGWFWLWSFLNWFLCQKVTGLEFFVPAWTKIAVKLLTVFLFHKYLFLLRYILQYHDPINTLTKAQLWWLPYGKHGDHGTPLSTKTNPNKMKTKFSWAKTAG